MNNTAAIFKPDTITVELQGEEYALVYDLNAFCELEKMYDSVDDILQMLFGTASEDKSSVVSYNGTIINSDSVLIDDVPLSTYIAVNIKKLTSKHTDTRNLLWAGMIHKFAVYDADGEITGYTLSKAKVGTMVTFKNLRQVNARVVTALLRDLFPADDEAKNALAPATEANE